VRTAARLRKVEPPLFRGGLQGDGFPVSRPSRFWHFKREQVLADLALQTDLQQPVPPLFSPAYAPGYNGGIDARYGAMKTRSGWPGECGLAAAESL